MVVRHRDVEIKRRILTHGQAVQIVLARLERVRERTATLAIAALGVGQFQLADLFSCRVKDIQRLAVLQFGQVHLQSGTVRSIFRTAIQAGEGHVVGIRGIHVRDGHGPELTAGRLRDHDAGSIVFPVDGDLDGLLRLQAGTIGDGDVEIIQCGLTIRQIVHVLRQLITVIAGLGVDIEDTMLPFHLVPDLSVDGHGFGILDGIVQGVAPRVIRSAIPAGGIYLARVLSHIFQHRKLQAFLVRHFRCGIVALDVDREFLFGDAAVAVIHHHGDLGINHIRRTQVLYRVESIIQLETVGTGFFVDIEGAVVGLVDVFAVYLAHRPITRSLQGIGQRIAVHIRGQGIARDRLVRTFLDGQHRLVQRQHRSVVGTVDGDGNGLCHFRTILVLDEDGEGLLQGLAVFSQFLYCLHLVVELIAVGTVRIDEKGTVLPGSHIAGVAACCALTGSHGITQIAFIYAVVRNVELVPDRDGGIFRGLKRELTAIDHRGFVGTRDGDVEIFLRAAVGSITAVVHSNGQVKVRILSGQQLFSFGTGLEGVAAVLVQRELAPVGTILGERIGAGGAHCLTILGSQGDA